MLAPHAGSEPRALLGEGRPAMREAGDGEVRIDGGRGGVTAIAVAVAIVAVAIAAAIAIAVVGVAGTSASVAAVAVIGAASACVAGGVS